MKTNTLLLIPALFAANLPAQKKGISTDSYLHIDSTFKKYQVGDRMVSDIDTTLIELKSDFTFSYKWSPQFGPLSRYHITQTGTYTKSGDTIRLTTKYQKSEWRFFESYHPEYGDSMVKVHVQTYDSSWGLFETWFIKGYYHGRKSDKMLLRDIERQPTRSCMVTLKLPFADTLYLYGSMGKAPIIVSATGHSNHFVLQYNLSPNYDYQYLKDSEWIIKGNTLHYEPGSPRGELILLKQ